MKYGYGKQHIDEDDLAAVADVLRYGPLTCGAKVKEFEDRIASYVNAKYAIAVSNGTAALHLLAMALRKPWRQTVHVPDITFMATANAFMHEGYKIELQDIGDIYSPNIARFSMTNITIPVHMAGHPVNLVGADKHRTIEDACHALGSKWFDGRQMHMVGDCEYSLATVFSFHPVKPITTGEGGMIVTNNEALATELRQLRSHGIKNSNYDIDTVGLNYRMTDIQAALGISQLHKLNRFIERRRAIATMYDTAFDDMGLYHIREALYQRSGYHLYIVFTPNPVAFRQHLADHGIGTQLHYRPLHTLKPYIVHTNPMPNATKYASMAVSIPIYYDLTDDDVNYIIGVIHEYQKSQLQDHTTN